ncbi:MAG TPA: hypothetical protein VL971_09605 [Rhizomicrobium sp.]|nr:hypothetical protein [Rhizomicrobium sp.]
MRISALGISAGVIIAGFCAIGARATDTAACGTQGDLHFICGMSNVEDMLPVDDGKWIVASSMTVGSAGFYLIDPASKTSKPVALSIGKAETPYDKCPGAPDLKTVLTHGLDVTKESGSTSLVFAVNHVGRQSVEVYRLTPSHGTAVWIGCVVLPAGAYPNAVVSLPDKSLAVTKFVDTGEKDGMADALAGKPNGLVYLWKPGAGWSEVAGSALPGDNGLVASADGKSLFVNAWGNSEVWRLPLSRDGKPVKVTLKFHPDNLRWAPDGSIFVTGQTRSDETAPPIDATGWSVARLDPKTMTVTPLFHYEGTPAFGYATSTVEADRTLFIGTWRGDKVAYRDAP